MAINSVPVDVKALMEHVTAVIGIDPVVDENGEQRRTGSGPDNNRPSLPKWKLYLSRLEPGRKREMVEIGFAANVPPEALPGIWPSFKNLRAMQWAMEGRAGLAIQADAVLFDSASTTPEKALEAAERIFVNGELPTAPKASPNGAKEPVAA